VSENPTKVLFILASGRTGSTVLGNVLGEIEGFFHAGELRRLWSHGLLHSRLCGCGTAVPDCPFWSSVLSSGFGEVDAARIFKWEQQAIRQRYALRFLRSPERARRSPALTSYVEAAGRLYQAMAEVAGASVIVDSSKRAQYATVLRLIPDVDPYWVHLVRDPRAVSYSWQRHKASPGGYSSEMPRRTPTTSTWHWSVSNLFGEAVRRTVRDRYLTVRYEDSMRQPETAVHRIADFVGSREVANPVQRGNTVRLGVNHTAGGNPDRLTSGTIVLRSDDEWVEKQQRMHRMVVTSMALPMLHRYGYPVVPSRNLKQPTESPLLRERG
jgi:hypothetical protein